MSGTLPHLWTGIPLEYRFPFCASVSGFVYREILSDLLHLYPKGSRVLLFSGDLTPACIDYIAGRNPHLTCDVVPYAARYCVTGGFLRQLDSVLYQRYDVVSGLRRIGLPLAALEMAEQYKTLFVYNRNLYWYYERPIGGVLDEWGDALMTTEPRRMSPSTVNEMALADGSHRLVAPNLGCLNVSEKSVPNVFAG